MSDSSNDFTRQLSQVRPLTWHLIVSVLLDQWPNDAAVMAFGIDSPRHYEALYYPIRNQEILPKAVDDALGSGQRLTAMTRAAASNPHRDSELAFSTIHDLGYDLESLRREIQADTAARKREEIKETLGSLRDGSMGIAANDNRKSNGLER